MSSTNVIDALRLLPESHERAAGIAHDRVRAGRAGRLVLEHLRAELCGALGLCREVLDLDVRNPPGDLALLRHHGREGARAGCEHRHPGGPTRAFPAEELFIELRGIR